MCAVCERGRERREKDKKGLRERKRKGGIGLREREKVCVVWEKA